MLDCLAKQVRPLLTLAFAATVIYLSITGKVSPEFIMGTANGIIAFWFGQKAGEALPQQLPQERREGQ